MGVKLNPSTYVQGGLLNDVDVELKEIRWTTFDFQGTADRPVLAARCVFVAIDGDGEEHEQFLSAGSLDRFIPDDDTEGRMLKQVGTGEKLLKGTNWDLFISSVADKGGDLTPLEEDISVLDGAKFHVIRVPAPKRGGNIQRRSDREPEVLVVDKVISLPWDKKGAAKGKTQAKPAAAAAKPAAAAAAKEEASDDDVMTVINAVSTVLAGGPNTISKIKILAFREFNKDKALTMPKKNALSAMITAELLAENGFTVDGDTVSMG